MLKGMFPRPLVWAVRSWLLATPVVAELYMLLNPRLRAQRVTRTTALVVDGFPRSANGFASYALRRLLSPGASVSSLTHATRVIHRAARLGRPCVLLIREPDPVVASILTYDPGHTEATAFLAYARYYERVSSVSQKVVVVDFETATTDIGAIARRLNERYRMGLDEARADVLRAEDVFAELDQKAQELLVAGGLDAELLSRRISRPVEGREHRDVAHDDPAWSRERARAWRAHQAVIG